MNIITRNELKQRIQEIYESLIRTESHDYAIAWTAVQLHVSKEEVTEVIDTLLEAA